MSAGRTVKAGAAVVLLAVVGACGVPTRDNSAPAPRTVEQVAIAPAAIEEGVPTTVTVTAKPAAPKTVQVTETATSTETVSEVPQACLDALDEADKIIAISADQGDNMAELLGAYSDFANGQIGASGLERALKAFSARTDANTEKVGDVDYGPQSAACRVEG